jgi:hypothetical protein
VELMRCLAALLFVIAVAVRAEDSTLPEKRFDAEASTHYFSDKSRVERVMNADSFRLRETYYDAQGRMLRKTVFELDEALQPIRSVTTDPNGRFTGRSEFVCANGKVAEERQFDGRGQLLMTRNFIFDKGGKFLGEVRKDGQGRVVMDTASGPLRGAGTKRSTGLAR